MTKQNKLMKVVLKNKSVYEEQQKQLEDAEKKLMTQVETLRNRKLILAGALSAVNKIIEDLNG